MEKQFASRLQGLETSINESSSYTQGHIGIHSFEVQAYNMNDDNVGDFSMQVAYPKNQDVIDIACFYEKDGEYFIATNISIRPILHARKHLVGKEVEGKIYDGLFTEGVGIIYSIEEGDISIIDAVKRALMHKLGLAVDAKNVVVGNPYFPSIGASGETCIPCFAEVDIPSDTQNYFLYGDRFEAQREIVFLSIQKIIDGFYAGEIEDMRLVLLAYDLAYRKGFTIISPLLISHTIEVYQKTDIDSSISLIQSTNQLEGFQDKVNENIQRVELLPQEYIASQFLKKYNIAVKNIYKDGSSESYSAETIVREGIDSVDMGSYFWNEGKIYMLCKESLRPSVQARNFQPHYIHAPGNIRDIEGIYASLCHPLPTTKTQLCDIAANRLTSKIDVAVTSSHYIGSYFPSMGNNVEKVHLVLQSVDPSVVKNIAEEWGLYKPRICAIELDTIIESYHQGILRDPRLVLIAYALKNIMKYEDVQDAPVTDKDRKAFQEAIHQPLQVDMFMKTVAQEKGDLIYDLHVTGKKYSVWYRRLVSYIEQELGGFLGERNWLLSESDQHFFSAMLPIFAVPSEELASKYINYITHDQGHYLQGDIIPYYPDTNTWMNKDEYIKYMSQTEANAVYDSDYLYPLQIGLERFEGLIGGESVATSFHKLGIYNDDEVHATIISIERDGIIPDKILQHDAYQEVRNNMIDRVLRFHVMDKIQASLQYEKRVKIPYVARIALQFCNTTNNIDEFNMRMNTYHDLIRHYDEGVNTLKAYVARIIVKHISLPALHIGTTMQMMNDTKKVGYETGIIFCEKLLNELLYRKHQTEKTRDSIVSMVANDTTIKAIRYANYIRNKVDVIYEKYLSFIVDTTLITNVHKIQLQSSRIPYFTGFAEMPTNLHDLVLEKEQENLKRVQK